jgi:hypothetical protein
MQLFRAGYTNAKLLNNYQIEQLLNSDYAIEFAIRRKRRKNQRIMNEKHGTLGLSNEAESPLFWVRDLSAEQAGDCYCLIRVEQNHFQTKKSL